MKKPRLTTLETRAARALEHLTEPGTAESFTVEWRKSRTWGNIAVIETGRGKAAEASGCGYDKLSACVVEYLRQLPDPAAVQAIRGCSGAGIRSVIDRLAEVGWNLEHVHNGRAEDGFRLSRITPVPASR